MGAGFATVGTEQGVMNRSKKRPLVSDCGQRMFPALPQDEASRYNEFGLIGTAKVAELADAPDLGSGGETRGGSSPPFRTISINPTSHSLVS